MLEGFAIVGVHRVKHKRVLRGGQRDEDRSHWLFGRPAARTGNAGDGQGVIRTAALPSALSHFLGDWLAHSAMCGQCFRADTEQALLGVIAIGDQAAEEDR